MRNIVSILRRDLGAYFTSPIGYIFIMVFVTMSVGLYVTSFFVFPVADMRPYFENLPLLLCIFIPAVTMRIWAEERKENTWEMLLTFPMQAWELTIGKFLAAVIFYVAALAATISSRASLPAPGKRCWLHRSWARRQLPRGTCPPMSLRCTSASRPSNTLLA